MIDPEISRLSRRAFVKQASVALLAMHPAAGFLAQAAGAEPQGQDETLLDFLEKYRPPATLKAGSATKRRCARSTMPLRA